jgi:hypothetical protein
LNIKASLPLIGILSGKLLEGSTQLTGALQSGEFDTTVLLGGQMEVATGGLHTTVTLKQQVSFLLVMLFNLS